MKVISGSLAQPLSVRYLVLHASLSMIYSCCFKILIFFFSPLFCFSEQCIEAYELLLALAESEQSLILGQFRAAGVGSVGKSSKLLI